MAKRPLDSLDWQAITRKHPAFGLPCFVRDRTNFALARRTKDGWVYDAPGSPMPLDFGPTRWCEK